MSWLKKKIHEAKTEWKAGAVSRKEARKAALAAYRAERIKASTWAAKKQARRDVAQRYGFIRKPRTWYGQAYSDVRRPIRHKVKPHGYRRPTRRKGYYDYERDNRGRYLPYRRKRRKPRRIRETNEWGIPSMEIPQFDLGF